MRHFIIRVHNEDWTIEEQYALKDNGWDTPMTKLDAEVLAEARFEKDTGEKGHASAHVVTPEFWEAYVKENS